MRGEAAAPLAFRVPGLSSGRGRSLVRPMSARPGEAVSGRGCQNVLCVRGMASPVRIAAMKVSAAPHRVDDLLRYLRRLGHEAEGVERGVVRVAPSDHEDAPAAVFALALALQLRVWNAVNEGEAQIVELSGSLEP
jgi:hypothetical protein